MTAEQIILVKWVSANKARGGVSLHEAITSTIEEIKTMLLNGGLYEDLRARGNREKDAKWPSK